MSTALANSSRLDRSQILGLKPISHFGRILRGWKLHKHFTPGTKMAEACWEGKHELCLTPNCACLHHMMKNPIPFQTPTGCGR